MGSLRYKAIEILYYRTHRKTLTEEILRRKEHGDTAEESEELDADQAHRYGQTDEHPVRCGCLVVLNRMIE